jgi:hypothetical protein
MSFGANVGFTCVWLVATKVNKLAGTTGACMERAVFATYLD